tara:strand:+ start:4019 stop:4705 length:687 start_codon:yes stop_codon:yes gene_type:complete
MAYGILLAFILSAVDYFTEGFFSRSNKFKIKFISLASGVSMAYLLLILFPEVYRGAVKYGSMLSLSVLFGFGVFHIIEKYIRQNYSNKRFEKWHHIMHSYSTFIYFAMVGYLIVKIADRNTLDGMLFFIPLLFHIIIDSLPQKMIKNNFHRVFFASSALIGGIISKYVISSEIVNIALLGIVAGALLYTITRESIPRGNKGDPAYFLLGTLLFTAIILVIWNITSSLY